MSSDSRAALVVRTLKEAAAAHERMAARRGGGGGGRGGDYDGADAGGSVLVFGNGGSAADAQHFAAEFVGRFEQERKAWPAMSLTTDTSALTAIGNDYGFDRVFARQIEALGQPGDVAIGITHQRQFAERVARAGSGERSRAGDRGPDRPRRGSGDDCAPARRGG